MKKFVLLLIILSILIIRCSNEVEESQTDTKTTEEAIDKQPDYFYYELEEETNTVKIEAKENKTNEIKTVNKVKETEENEVKVVNEKINENIEEKTDSEITDENKIDHIEKIVYISKTGKKYHVENCRTLRAEKEAIDLNEAIKTGYEACKVCNPDNVVGNN